MANNKSYINKRLASFKFAFKGIITLFRKEINAQIHLLAAIYVVSLGFFFEITKTEWCIVILTIAIVIAAEGFNTAIEKITDSIYKEHNETAGNIKDIAAGAVLICAIAAAIIGIIIFLPYVLKLF